MIFKTAVRWLLYMSVDLFQTFWLFFRCDMHALNSAGHCKRPSICTCTSDCAYVSVEINVCWRTGCSSYLSIHSIPKYELHPARQQMLTSQAELNINRRMGATVNGRDLKMDTWKMIGNSDAVDQSLHACLLSYAPDEETSNATLV